MHDADNWEKIPILEARAIGYRTGPKTGNFSPLRSRARNSLVRWSPGWQSSTRDQKSKTEADRKCEDSLKFLYASSIIVSDGNLCGLETREGPWSGGVRTPPFGAKNGHFWGVRGDPELNARRNLIQKPRVWGPPPGTPPGTPPKPISTGAAEAPSLEFKPGY